MNRFTLVAVSALLMVSAALTEESPKTFENDKGGIRATRPEDPSWKFIPDNEWVKMFTDPRNADSVCLWLVKMKTPEGTPGQEAAQVHFVVRNWDQDARFDFDGKIVEATSVKSFAKAMLQSFKQDYKDIKDEKELGEMKGYKFASKILKFSFMGVNKQYGQPAWIQCIFFKENKKVYCILIEVPAGNEKVFAKDLDTILKSIELYEKK